MKKRPYTIWFGLAAVAIAVSLAYSLSRGAFPNHRPETSISPNMDTVSIEQAIQAAHAWLTLPGVAGVGQGKTNEQDCIVVFLTGDTTSLAGKIPATFMGHPVTFQDLGSPVEAQ